MSSGFEKLLDSVVRIDVREMNFDDGARRIDASIGSGVILSQDGLILTNAHVAGPKAVEINVTLSNLERVGARWSAGTTGRTCRSLGSTWTT
jgi:serine protease Do